MEYYFFEELLSKTFVTICALFLLYSLVSVPKLGIVRKFADLVARGNAMIH